MSSQCACTPVSRHGAFTLISALHEVNEKMDRLFRKLEQPQVTDIDVVDSRRGSILIDTESPMLSLVTCYPFSAADAGGPLRFVVTAKMIF